MYRAGPELSLENVYNKISSYHIFKFYCKGFEQEGQKFYSEFRNEKEPSCSIRFYKGDLLYKDFGTGESYRAVSYVMRKYNLRFIEALDRVNQDFGLNLMSYKSNGTISIKNTACDVKSLKVPMFKEYSPTIIRVKKKPWDKRSLGYWLKYGWTLDMLKKADIYPISYYWVKNDRKDYRMYVNNKSAYTIEYYWNDGVFRRKIYIPGIGARPSFFVSNVDPTIVQGVKLLPKQGGELLFVTSSIKDCGVFWRLGYNAVAPNNEGSFLPDKFYNKIKDKWERIIIWYDNDWHKGDNPGKACAEKYAKIYNIDYFHNPDGEPKDPSDFVAHYGIEKGLHMFNRLISQKCRIAYPTKKF